MLHSLDREWSCFFIQFCHESEVIRMEENDDFMLDDDLFLCGEEAKESEK